MYVSYISVMHKILTVWTKFLHIFLLWMLLSKSDFLNDINEKSGSHLRISSLCNSQRNLINQNSSNSTNTESLPKVSLLKMRTRSWNIQHQGAIRTIFRSSLPSSNSLREIDMFSRIFLFPVNMFSTFVTASSQTLPDFTTENGLFTGLPLPIPDPLPPLGEFDVSVNETFGTFMYIKISWNATINITKVELRFENAGGIMHHLEIPSLFLEDIENVFPPKSGRIGFIYQLGGLEKSRRYYLQGWGFVDGIDQPLYDKQSFLTSDKDIYDRIYDLNGIFMVLGISTILMVMVMCCVGYEKLIHQKKRMAVDILCCRRKKPKKNRIQDGSISPELLTREHNIKGLPSPEDEFVRAGPSRVLAF